MLSLLFLGRKSFLQLILRFILCLWFLQFYLDVSKFRFSFLILLAIIGLLKYVVWASTVMENLSLIFKFHIFSLLSL